MLYIELYTSNTYFILKAGCQVAIIVRVVRTPKNQYHQYTTVNQITTFKYKNISTSYKTQQLLSFFM